MEPTDRISAGVSSLRDSRGAPSTELLKKLRRIVIFGFHIPPQDADDVLQEALLHFIRERRHRAVVTDGLLVIITRRRCLDYWRDRNAWRAQASPRDVETLDDEGAMARRLYYGACIAQAWPGISPGCRQILTNRFSRPNSTEDLAEQLGRNPDTVRRFISRCLKRLRARLKERP